MTNEDCRQYDKTTFMQLGPLLLFPPHSGNCHSLYLLSLTPQIIYPSLPQSLIPYIPYVPSLRPLSERGISLTVYVALGAWRMGLGRSGKIVPSPPIFNNFSRNTNLRRLQAKDSVMKKLNIHGRNQLDGDFWCKSAWHISINAQSFSTYRLGLRWHTISSFPIRM